MICILILLGSCAIVAMICVIAAAMLSSRVSRYEESEEITTMENARLFIGDESFEITSYQIGVDPAFGKDESVGVWYWVDNTPKPIELTFDITYIDWWQMEVLFDRPFYHWPKWVMQVVLFLSFIILVMVLS